MQQSRRSWGILSILSWMENKALTFFNLDLLKKELTLFRKTVNMNTEINRSSSTANSISHQLDD